MDIYRAKQKEKQMEKERADKEKQKELDKAKIGGVDKNDTGPVVPIATTDWLKVGSRMIYSVEKGGQTYDINIVIKQIKPNIAFNYDAQGKRGSISFENKAVDSEEYDKYNDTTQKETYGFVIDFKGGEEKLSDKTALFLSMTEYKALMASAARIDVNSTPMFFAIDFDGDAAYSVPIKGKTQRLTCVTSKTDEQDKSSVMQVLSDDKYPLMLSLKLPDAVIKLKEVQ